jgi:hypothetical protein
MAAGAGIREDAALERRRTITPAAPWAVHYSDRGRVSIPR